VEFQQLAVCKELAKRGHEVEVFTSDLYSEIPWKRLDGKCNDVEGIPVRRFRAISLPGDFQYSIMPDMLRAVYFGKWDIIHAHSYGFWPSHVGSTGGYLGRGKFVFTPHLHPGETSWGGKKRKTMRRMYDRFVARDVIKEAERIICVSEGERRYALESGFDPDKTVIVSDSVDITRFESLQEGEFRQRYGLNDSEFVLFVGRLAKNKGLEHLVSAIPIVLEQYPDTKFVLLGEDERMKEILLQRARELNVKESLIFTGALDYQSVSSAFLDCTVFVLPSQYEAFGIVLAEAQAARKPVVATKVGGVPNVVRDRKTGILVDYGNPKDLAMAINSFLGDPEKRNAFGESGFEWIAQNFSIDKVVDRLEDVYNEVLESKNKKK
jgi:glycosyltransferase involved in cell wall biosynthesis